MAKMSLERIEQMIRDFEEKNRMSGHAACTHPDSTKSTKLSRIPSGVRASALLAVALLAVLVPLNRTTGTHVGMVAEFHLFFDDIFPNSIGKPIFP